MNHNRFFQLYRIIFTLIVVVLITTAGFFLLYHTPASKNKDSFCVDCNIILISLDSLRRDHLGIYGYERDTSPNLDRWAKGAFIFDQHITTSHITPVSEMSLHTSLYPSSSGVIDFLTLLPENKKTIAEILKTYAYHTVAIGSSSEFSQRFDVMKRNFSRGFDRYFEEEQYKNLLSTREITSSLPDIKDWNDYSTIRDGRGLPINALVWLRNNSKEKFFLWIPVGTIHWPYQGYSVSKPSYFSDNSYSGIFANDPIDWFMLSRVYKGLFYPRGEESTLQLSTDDTQFIIDRYDDGIFLVDKFLGAIFSILKETKLDKKTIVIISSEHGEDFGEHGYFAHYDIFDTQTRTPLIIKFPNMDGGRVTEQISNIDVLPTLLEALSIPIPDQAEGESFFSFLVGEADSAPRKYAFIERAPLWESVVVNNITTFLPPHETEWLNEFKTLDYKHHYKDVAVRTKKWKLIYRESLNIQKKFSWWQNLSGKQIPYTEYELYNLAEDPEERSNVFGQYPEVGRALKEVLLDWKERINGKKTEIQQIKGLPQPYF